MPNQLFASFRSLEKTFLSSCLLYFRQVSCIRPRFCKPNGTSLTTLYEIILPCTLNSFPGIYLQELHNLNWYNIIWSGNCHLDITCLFKVYISKLFSLALLKFIAFHGILINAYTMA